jgi:uncharacterized membrane protein
MSMSSTPRSPTAVDTLPGWQTKAIWAMVLLQLLFKFAPFLGAPPQLGLVSLVLLLVFAFWHGAIRYGVRGILALFIVTMVVSFCLENLSVATGFPFGNYYYPRREGLGPNVFQVPLVIGASYFANGYLAWNVANILLDRPEERLNLTFNRIALPLVAAFVMVMWDVGFDPIRSTIEHIWIWRDGGGYNGVPLTNFLGWYLTVWIIYQTFALFLSGAGRGPRPSQGRSLSFAPIVLYVLNIVPYLHGYLLLENRTVVDSTGRSWQTSGIYETAIIVSLYGIVFVAFLAALRLFSPDQRAPRA